jgi:hypothetical protein
MGQARSPMTDFLIDCYFNHFCKGIKNFFFDSALCHIAQSWSWFYLRLCAMPLSVKFKSKIFLPTPHYAAQRGVDSALRRIVGSRDSALCRIAQSCDSVLCRIGQSCDIARSRFSSSNRIELLRKFESICKPVLAHESGTHGYSLMKITRSNKSRETVPLRRPNLIT